MKHIIFDCFAGFTPQMVLGALADLYANHRELKAYIQSVVPSAELTLTEVTRSSMKALLAHTDPGDTADNIGYSELEKMIEGYNIDGDIKKCLKSWLYCQGEAMAFDPADVCFEGRRVMADVLSIAASLHIISELGAEDIYCTAPMVSSGTGTENDETGYICRKYNIPTTVVPCDVRLSDASGAALIAAMNPSFVRPRGVITLNAGYGAGDADTADMPNVLRAAIVEDDNASELELEAESLFAEINTTYANI